MPCPWVQVGDAEVVVGDHGAFVVVVAAGCVIAIGVDTVSRGALHGVPGDLSRGRVCIGGLDVGWLAWRSAADYNARGDCGLDCD